MKRVAEGGSIEIAPAEVFVIERRALDGAGFRTSIEAPEGVVHRGTRDPTTSNFGGHPKVEETFECERRGRFEIRFVSRRPWEEGSRVVVSKVFCR